MCVNWNTIKSYRQTKEETDSEIEIQALERNPTSIKYYMWRIKNIAFRMKSRALKQIKPNQAESNSVCNSSVCISHLCHDNSLSLSLTRSLFVCLWIKSYQSISRSLFVSHLFTICVYFLSWNYACFPLKLLSCSLPLFLCSGSNCSHCRRGTYAFAYHFS